MGLHGGVVVRGYKKWMNAGAQVGFLNCGDQADNK